MRLNRAWIESRIPHHGRMCLLDEVIAWSAARVSCRSSTHREPDNPLRAHGRLGIACGIEYAAQAMAVHGALVGASSSADRGATLAGTHVAASAAPRPPSVGRPAAGFLAAVRDVRFHSLRLDDVPGDLICDAVRMAGDATTALYEFELRSEAALLLRGRATVVFDAGLYPSLRPGGSRLTGNTETGSKNE
jgi:predicted hotdog family 3-hydroxylacyl-ACP dehydratase